MPGSEVLVQIALGIAAIGALLLALRWGWNSRRREGASKEKAEALERAVVESGEREEKVRKQRGLTHAAWKRQGKKLRARRAPDSKPRK